MIVGVAAALMVVRGLYLNAFDLIKSDTGGISGGFIIRAGTLALACGAFLWFVSGKANAVAAWQNGKGMVSPLLVVFVVLGSIYGGITGITEAAGIGSFAV